VIGVSIVAGSDDEAIERAAQTLAAGELVGVPTETVYGLAARADDDRAVARIFETKGRPSDHPLIVHVASREQAQPLAAPWSDGAGFRWMPTCRSRKRFGRASRSSSQRWRNAIADIRCCARRAR